MARIRTAEEIKRSIESTKHYIDKTTAKLNSYQRKLEVLENELKDVQKALEKFRYRKGQAVYHKKLGNCLISSLQLTNNRVRAYRVISLNEESQIVSESELLPITQATEILYAGGKNG